MICNLGSINKVIRRTTGLVIIGWGFYFKTWYGLIGLVPIALSFINYCPMYLPFKINLMKGAENDI